MSRRHRTMTPEELKPIVPDSLSNILKEQFPPRQRFVTVQPAFTQDAWSQWKWFVDRAPGEISAMGKISEDVSFQPVISDLKLLKQVNGMASSDMDDMEVLKFFMDSLPEEERIHWKGHMHSHAQMDCFYSGTDTKTIDEFGKDYDYLVSVVTNKKGDCISRFDVFTPVHLHIEFKTTPVLITNTVDTVELEKIYQSISPTRTYGTGSYYSEGSYYNQGQTGFWQREYGYEDDHPKWDFTKVVIENVSSKEYLLRLKRWGDSLFASTESTFNYPEHQEWNARITNRLNALKEEEKPAPKGAILLPLSSEPLKEDNLGNT